MMGHEVKRPQFSLVLPCFNEAALFRDSVEKIIATLANSRYTSEIIFVDDMSHDGTQALIEKICSKYDFCRAIYHPKNTGRGRTVADGIRVAKGKVVGYIDIDLEVSPIYIPDAVALILERHADVVIGQRIYRTNVVSIFREVLSRGYRSLAASLVATGGLDTESGYKFFNRTKILPIIGKIKHQGWFWDTEIIVFAKKAGLRIVELPVLFLRRTDKKSSVRIFHDMIDYLISLWRLKKRLE